jgi:aryl-alcohol dehydrogenase-like predicted oxidoreductase
MELRKLGSSDIEIPPVVFGAWAIGGWFWGGTDDDGAVEAIRAGIDAGITAIDTAPMYGFGHSESVVGRAIKGRRDEVIVATKCGLRWDVEKGEFFFTTEDQSVTDPEESNKVRPVYRLLERDSIIEECDLSLKRLGVDTIDLYQCHWPDSTTPLDETMEAMLRLREQGKIREIGVSNFTSEMMEKCLSIGPIVSDQPKYSLLAREIEEDVLPFCREHDLATLVYSPLAQGLLTGKVTMERTFPEGDMRVNSPWYAPVNRKRVLDVLAKLSSMADDHGATLAQLVINWTVHEPGVTAAIVGGRNPAQVRENAGALDFTLSEDERRIIRAAFEDLGEPRDE